MNNSVAMSAPIELIKITPFNPLISKCQIKVCWVGDEPNPNKSIITKETAYGLANSLPGSPIVGYYNEQTEDFEQHNKIIEIKNGKFQLKPTTKPYGFVDLNAKIWFQKFSDNGVEREYLVTEGWLWTGQFPECQRTIDKGNNQSMELDDTYIDAYWTKDINGEPEFFIINEAIISKLCILGEDYRPCFEGANITAPKIEFSLGDDFKEQLFSMIEELKNIISEGGTSMLDNEQVLDAEEFAAKEDEVCPKCGKPLDECECNKEEEEEFAKKEEEAEGEDKDICPECGKPIDECECDKEDKKAKYILEEIPEYIELQTKYSALETQYDELNNAHEALKAENESLVSFKLNIEKKEKEAMIESFYMLSDEDKEDVIANIDTYSLEDIEAKLSIICVRNKVNFSLDEDNKASDPTVYNLQDDGCADDNVPEWVKALRQVANNN